MPLFCEVCNNLLSKISTADTFYFNCVKCKSNYKPTDNDSLRYESTHDTNIAVYNIILQNARKDPVNPKVNKKCKKCDNNIVKQVRLTDDMRLINVCTECNEQWLENTIE